MDAARLAAMSDPTRNFHFGRGWDEPPPLRRERPGIAGTMHGANIGKRSSTTEDSLASRLSQAAARIDREADFALHLGYHRRAEYLAQQACALRADGR